MACDFVGQLRTSAEFSWRVSSLVIASCRLPTQQRSLVSTYHICFLCVDCTVGFDSIILRFNKCMQFNSFSSGLHAAGKVKALSAEINDHIDHGVIPTVLLPRFAEISGRELFQGCPVTKLCSRQKSENVVASFHLSPLTVSYCLLYASIPYSS